MIHLPEVRLRLRHGAIVTAILLHGVYRTPLGAVIPPEDIADVQPTETRISPDAR